MEDYEGHVEDLQRKIHGLEADLARVTAERDGARVVAENLLEDIAWITSDKPCPKCGAGVSCRCWGCVAKKAEAERDEARAEVERMKKELDEGDSWQDRAKKFLANGNCPICFGDDEGGHKKGCGWGVVEAEVERLMAVVNSAIKCDEIEFQGLVSCGCDLSVGPHMPGCDAVNELHWEIIKYKKALAGSGKEAKP